MRTPAPGSCAANMLAPVVEAYRLGEVCSKIRLVEPVMRDADIVSIDMKSIRAAELSSRQKFSPNGFDGKEICAISRYAGISNKVSSFGVFEYKSSNEDEVTEMLISQIIWYFIEGVNCRIIDSDFSNEDEYNKFTVIVDEYDLIFYKNKTHFIGNYNDQIYILTNTFGISPNRQLWTKCLLF